MAVAIAVRVRFFARLRELAGIEIEVLHVPPGATLAEAYDASRGQHPALPPRESVRAALNQEFADWTAQVANGDEVAFIPPVSGGAHKVGILFELTTDPLDSRRLEAAVAHPGAGGICTFTGVVRDNARGRSVTQLEYEAFAEMATAQMRKIGDEIADKWPEARAERRRSRHASGGSTGSRSRCRSGRRSTRPTARTGSRETKRSRSPSPRR